MVTVRAAPPRPRLAARPAGPRAALVETALCLAVALVGLAIRLPNLLTVPRFTDEQIEVIYAFPLARLQALPLIGPDPYNGPLHTYLLALGLWLFGPQPETPRLVSALAGAATVGLTYLLGASLGGRLAGLIAAGLLATSVVHVVVNSHVAWSSATTPLFTTLAFLILVRALRRRGGPLLALAGLAFALALQTHPSVVAFLPGVALGLLLRRRRVGVRWLALGLLVFVLGYANVPVFNLRPTDDPYRRAAADLLPGWFVSEGETGARLAQQQRTYAGGQGGPAFFVANLGSLAHNLPRLAASLVEPLPSWTDYLARPAFWAYGLLLLLGLAWPARRGDLALPLAGLSFLCVIPLFTGKLEPVFNGRYLMPLLPLGFAGLGGAAAGLYRRAPRPLPRLALLLVAAGLVLYPLLGLTRYEQRAAEEGELNLDLIATAATIRAARAAGEPLLLDEALGRRGLPADGDLLQSLRVLLELREVSYRVGPATLGRLEGQLDGARTALVVFAQPYDRDLERRFRFDELEDKGSGRYRLYRLERRP